MNSVLNLYYPLLYEFQCLSGNKKERRVRALFSTSQGFSKAFRMKLLTQLQQLPNLFQECQITIFPCQEGHTVPRDMLRKNMSVQRVTNQEIFVKLAHDFGNKSCSRHQCSAHRDPPCMSVAIHGCSREVVLLHTVYHMSGNGDLA